MYLQANAHLLQRKVSMIRLGRVQSAMSFLALAVIGLMSGAAADTDTLRQGLNAGVAHGYPGFAMLVHYPDGRTLTAAEGYANLEMRRKLRTDDAFHLASVTKVFTAVATLRLVDQGKLSLNDRIIDVLGPDVVGRVPFAARITVAQLLDHSSGIHPINNELPYLNTLLGPQANPTVVWAPQQFVELASEGRAKPEGEPGTGHHYSDTNYILLGMIVEKIAGRPLRDQVRDTVFRPLHMTDSYYYSRRLGMGATAHGRTTQGYLLPTDEIKSFIAINPMFRPAGRFLNTTLAAERIDAAAGIVSTLPDLLKFAEALFGGRLLSPESQKFLMAAGDGMDKVDIGEHRTWAMQAIRQPYGTLVYKEGDGPGGVNTLMAFQPATGAIYLGFTNSFGFFDEVDFMMKDVIGKLASRIRASNSPSALGLKTT
jgi:CubicO group peptidase (beta-lactamase class C family)